MGSIRESAINEQVEYMVQNSNSVSNDSDDVISFLTKVYPCGNIHLESTLGDDMGLDGDEAYELLNEYALHFNVDMSGFVFSDYFGDEYPPCSLSRLIGSFFKKPEKTKKDLTIGDLVEAVKRGKLV
jgi:hypothetical protein